MSWTPSPSEARALARLARAEEAIRRARVELRCTGVVAFRVQAQRAARLAMEADAEVEEAKGQ